MSAARNKIDFSILILYPVMLLNSCKSYSSFWMFLPHFLHRQLCYLWIKTSLILSFLPGYLLFLLLSLLLWLEIPLKYWKEVVMVDIPFFFLIVEENIQSLNIKHNYSCRFFSRCHISGLGYSLLFLLCSSVFSGMDAAFCWMLVLRWLCFC